MLGDTHDIDRSFDPDLIEGVRRRSLTPTEALMAAVLEQAVADIRQTINPRVRAEAYWYLYSTDTRWEFSFENLCEHFALSASSIRRAVGITDGIPYSLAKAYPERTALKQRLHALFASATSPVLSFSFMQRTTGANGGYLDEVLREMVADGEVERVKWGLYQVAA